MPYSQPGTVRHATATKATVHGAACIENGIPGTADKNTNLGPFVDPASADATLIAIGEEFAQTVKGIVEVPRTGDLATADVGAAAVSDIYIDEDDNTLHLAAQALTAAALNATFRKFGKVVERDTTRTPQILRVDLDLKSCVKGNDA